MRPASLPLLGFAFLVLAPLSCSSEPGEKVIRASQAIQGGTVDENDSAVVAILINTSQGMSLCSGALVGPNLVLSAHHCVADPPSNLACGNKFGSTYAASSFVVTTSYDAAGLIFNSASAVFPTPDGVTWFGVGSVSVPGTNICGQDLSALQLSSAITGVCPLIPAVDVSVTTNQTYEAIGFGITSPSGATAGTRYEVGGMVVQCVDCGDPTMSATEEWLGGSSNPKGTCEGDSGGPAIDSRGRVIGSVSRGPSNACNSTVYESYYGEGTWIKAVAAQAATGGGYTAAGWVTGGSTANSANGYCAAVVTDAGASDAGATVDGGSQDAGGEATDGESASSDAGAGDSGIVTSSDSGAMDAGEDAGTVADEDSGATSDDAGTINPAPEDAGVGEDAGVTTGTDASTSAPAEDASTSAADDAGGSSSGDAPAGCGCTVVGGDDSRTGTGALGGVLFGFVALARRRRGPRG